MSFFDDTTPPASEPEQRVQKTIDQVRSLKKMIDDNPELLKVLAGLFKQDPATTSSTSKIDKSLSLLDDDDFVEYVKKLLINLIQRPIGALFFARMWRKLVDTDFEPGFWNAMRVLGMVAWIAETWQRNTNLASKQMDELWSAEAAYKESKKKSDGK